MGAAWGATSKGGGVTESLGKFLPRSSSGGSLVWVGDMGAHRDNQSEDRVSACEFLLRQVTRKEAMRRRDGSWRQVPPEEVI